MSKLNPRVDFAFKILFGSEENKDILLPFVNSVLSLEYPLTELTLLNPYNHKTHSTDKLSILDIKAKDELGKHYHIEMQMTDQVSYDQRTLYYWSKLYSQQLSEGKGYGDLRKTISIHILNFNHFDEPDYHNIYHILNAKTYRRAFEDLEFHFIELKKFNKDLSHLTTALDRWATFLSKAEQWERNFVPEELKDDPAIAKAAHALDVLALDEEEREIYEAQLKALRDQTGTILKAREEAEAVGMEKGKKEGRKEGEAIGLEKGREEGREEGKEEVALRLMSKGSLSIEEISDMTGISLAVLKKLQQTKS